MGYNFITYIALLLVPEWNWNLPAILLIEFWFLLLLVPEWNWNLEFFKLIYHVYSLLLVPEWNWNLFLWHRNHWYLLLLLVPEWNWNKSKAEVVKMAKRLLLVPEWNWNFVDIDLGKKDVEAFTCTRMELKRKYSGTITCFFWSFTCTRMELKLGYCGVYVSRQIPFYLYQNGIETRILWSVRVKADSLLLVPEWNWN